MKQRARSPREQSIVHARVAAASQLQAHRPKVQETEKVYNRNKQKRLWQKDQEALHPFWRYSRDRAALAMTGSSCSASC